MLHNLGYYYSAKFLPKKAKKGDYAFVEFETKVHGVEERVICLLVWIKRKYEISEVLDKDTLLPVLFWKIDTSSFIEILRKLYQ